MRLPCRNLTAMGVHVWQQQLDPGFPLAVIEYVAQGDGDPMHWHDHLEIAHVLDGRGDFRFGRRALAAEPGDVFFIDNSQPHVAVTAPDGRLRLLLVLFRPELIAGPGCRELDLGYLAPFRVDESAASARLPAGTEPAAEVAIVLRELQVIWQRRDPAERQLADATLRRALALVNRGRQGGQPPARARASGDRREQIRPVLAYVDRHRGENVTLAEVAELIHVSPSRVRHVFKDVTGVGFKEYVTQVRVAEAKRLLLSTELSVAETARAVSYTNLHQFYKVFQRTCSMSPAEYRRYYMRTDRTGAAAGRPAARRAAVRLERSPQGPQAGEDTSSPTRGGRSRPTAHPMLPDGAGGPLARGVR
jgi:AraC-like DNA-binding protein/mannose-6-phosphate isomerase-like protein (cupin superfamily)